MSKELRGCGANPKQFVIHLLISSFILRPFEESAVKKAKPKK